MRERVSRVDREKSSKRRVERDSKEIDRRRERDRVDKIDRDDIEEKLRRRDRSKLEETDYREIGERDKEQKYRERRDSERAIEERAEKGRRLDRKRGEERSEIEIAEVRDSRRDRERDERGEIKDEIDTRVEFSSEEEEDRIEKEKKKIESEDEIERVEKIEREGAKYSSKPRAGGVRGLVIRAKIMAASAIAISSYESVGSPPSRVILFGDIPTVIPSTSVVAPKTSTIAPIISSAAPMMRCPSPEHISPLPATSPSYARMSSEAPDTSDGTPRREPISSSNPLPSSSLGLDASDKVGPIETGVDMELGIGDGDDVGDHVKIDLRDVRDDTEEYEAGVSAGDTAEWMALLVVVDSVEQSRMARMYIVEVGEPQGGVSWIRRGHDNARGRLGVGVVPGNSPMMSTQNGSEEEDGWGNSLEVFPDNSKGNELLRLPFYTSTRGQNGDQRVEHVFCVWCTGPIPEDCPKIKKPKPRVQRRRVPDARWQRYALGVRLEKEKESRLLRSDLKMLRLLSAPVVEPHIVRHVEMEELSTQLQELSDKGFIRPMLDSEKAFTLDLRRLSQSGLGIPKNRQRKFANFQGSCGTTDDLVEGFFQDCPSL
ncbi:hypothetical protein Tco_0972785 [Tanacetum coccineum]